jgi:subtilisin family serine protease
MRKMNAIYAALIAAALIPIVTAAPSTSPGEHSGAYIVGFFEPPGLAVGETYHGDRIVAVDNDLNFVVVITRDATRLQANAAQYSNVRYVEFDDPAYASLYFVPNDTHYTHSAHYGTKIIGAETAWDRTLGSTSIKVAVVDTGINRNHEDFVGGRVLQGRDTIHNDNDPEDQGGQCAYHGSHTAGTIGATINNAKGIAGLAQVSILPVKIFKQGGPGGCSTTTTAIVSGLKYAGDQGAHVSSNSWGGGGSSTAINDAIKYAHDRGTIHVAAAGNSGSCTNCVGQPWKDMGHISIVVSCSNASDGWCSFSSQGPQVDLIAPGSGVASVDGSSTTGYKTMSGTSMSAPHVSGTVALVKTLNPSMSFTNVENRLKSTADDIGMISDRQGAGRVDAGEAVS